MHGSAVGATAVPASGHSHHAAASAESGHGGHAPASAPTHQHHACTCIGACAGSAAVALTTSAPELPALTIAYRPASILPSGERLARPAPSFSRPYTTGPPRAWRAAFPTPRVIDSLGLIGIRRSVWINRGQVAEAEPFRSLRLLPV